MKSINGSCGACAMAGILVMLLSGVSHQYGGCTVTDALLTSAFTADCGGCNPHRDEGETEEGESLEGETEGESCQPEIMMDSVPAYGRLGNLSGRVTCLPGNDADAYRLAVFIEVDGGIWTKPYFAAPLTVIHNDGTWSCPIVTGGNDRNATGIAAYLIPAGVEAPLCGPCGTWPEIPASIAGKIINRPAPGRRITAFGREWSVKFHDSPAGPGNNYFTDDEDALWADEEGLHLTISEREGQWRCSEVILDASLGYGTYRIVTTGRVDLLDPNVILGLFTWDTGAAAEHYRELDFEFARWGNAAEPTNAQYVVQPCNACPGCDDRCHRFRANLTDEAPDLTNYMVWTSGRVEFASYYGKYAAGETPPKEKQAAGWIYEGDGVPTPGNENFRINLWLFNGQPPSDGQPVEAVITDFSWQAEPAKAMKERISNP